MAAIEIMLLRRRLAGDAGPPIPGIQKNGELTFNEPEEVLYYGKGDDGTGKSVENVAVGGRGAFMLNSQRLLDGGGWT